MQISDLKIGESARIVGLNAGNLAFRQRLLALGLIPGAEITVVRIAPFGDPIELKVKRSSVCMRRNEANILQIERLL